MADMPDYQKKIVVEGTAVVDLIKIDGVDIATPTITACVPISIENDAIAYDAVNDRFTIDIEKWSATDIVSISGDVDCTQAGTWNIGTVTTVTTVATVTSITNTVNVSIQNSTIAVTQSGTWNVGTITTVTTVATVTSITNTVNVSVQNATLAVTQSGTWNVGTVTTVTTVATVTSITNAVTVNTHAVTQSGTWTVAVSGTVTITATALTDIETNTDNLVKVATTPAIYNVTMTNANTEYSQALPTNTKKFMIHCRDGTEFRLAFVTGKVATPTEPYFTIPEYGQYNDDNILTSGTIYIGCATTGKVIEIIAWS